MTKSRDDMIQFIAEEWADNIDIKSYLRQMFYEYADQLDDWTDEQIQNEYKTLTTDEWLETTTLYM